MKLEITANDALRISHLLDKFASGELETMEDCKEAAIRVNVEIEKTINAMFDELREGLKEYNESKGILKQ